MASFLEKTSKTLLRRMAAEESDGGASSGKSGSLIREAERGVEQERIVRQQERVVQQGRIRVQQRIGVPQGVVVQQGRIVHCQARFLVREGRGGRAEEVGDAARA